MYRAASAVTTGLREIQCFHYHTLPGKRGITVHQNRQYLRTVLVTAALHPRLARAFDHWVDDFEM